MRFIQIFILSISYPAPNISVEVSRAGPESKFCSDIAIIERTIVRTFMIRRSVCPDLKHHKVVTIMSQRLS